MKIPSFLLALSLALLAGCGRSSNNNAPAASKPPAQSSTPMLHLAPGECGDPDGTHGYVRIKSSDASGLFENCSFGISSNGLTALKAQSSGGKQNSAILLTKAKPGTERCHDDAPTAVNYRAVNPAGVLYIAHGANMGKCEIKTAAIDAKHWKGSATATLVPGGKDQHNPAAKPIELQVEWDLHK